MSRDRSAGRRRDTSKAARESDANLAALIDAVLNKSFIIKRNGKTSKSTSLEICLDILFKKAMASDAKALATYMKYIEFVEKVLPSEPVVRNVIKSYQPFCTEDTEENHE